MSQDFADSPKYLQLYIFSLLNATNKQYRSVKRTESFPGSLLPLFINAGISIINYEYYVAVSSQQLGHCPS